MKEWKDILVELARKLTALFAFVVLIVIVIAVFGGKIPAVFQALIYIVVIGGLLIYALQQFLQIRARHDRNEKADEAEPTAPVAVPQPAPVETPKPALPVIPDAFSARERYLRAMVAECRTVRLAGIDPNASDPTRGGMSLEKLYISLDTRTSKEKPDEEQKKSGVRLPGQEPKPMSALEAWTSSPKRRMVLLGLPGTGKSTFVRYLALSMARAELSREAELPQEWRGRPLIPFILPLGRFAETIPSECRKGRAELVEEYLVQNLKSGEDTREFAPLALHTLEREGGLVMFDGLDEVANLNLRPLVVQAVEDFVEKYSRNPQNFFLVTCRTYSYQHDAAWKLTDWPTHELALLTREKVEFFIQAWYAELSQIDASRQAEYERKRNKLLETLQPGDRRKLLEIAAFPLILTIMAVVHTHYGELPDTRAQVYERCVELLLIRWQGERSVAGKLQKQNILDALDISPTVLYQALWEVAYRTHGDADKDASRDGSAALVTEDLLDGVLKVYLQNRDKVETFLEYCQSSNGLLMLQGTLSVPGKPPRKVYAFPHLTFEEYLAARYLADHDPEEYAYELVGRSDRWREALKLLGEHLCFGSPQRPQMTALLDALSVQNEQRSELEQARMTWLAGELLVLYNRAFEPRSPYRERQGVISALNQAALQPEFDPQVRANCADIADELGGWQVDDLYEFVRVEQKDNLFHIAKHPVTNLQYQHFLASKDYAEERFWVDFPKFDEQGRPMKETWGKAGWEWLKQAQQDKDDAPDGRVILPRYWNDPRFGIARRSAPVVGITWWEVNAYCRWLAEQHTLPEYIFLSSLLSSPSFRLPTEAEWVLAAGGQDKGRYPWDAKGQVTSDEREILRRANIGESRIGRTTSVGMYPLGRAQNGLWDLAGNVWEWQANFYDTGHDVMGLRGGSWLNILDLARVSARNPNHPGIRWDDYGFRVVAFSPPS